MMSHNHVIFPLLYKLSASSSSTKDSASILSTLSRLLHKIPTDTNVIEDFESIEIETNHSAADASPKVSPRKTASSREMAAETIHKLLDPYAVGMSALRVWYNLSVLSSRLMPIQGCHSNPLSFTQHNYGASLLLTHHTKKTSKEVCHYPQNIEICKTHLLEDQHLVETVKYVANNQM